jgi:hypothetical protein
MNNQHLIHIPTTPAEQAPSPCRNPEAPQQLAFASLDKPIFALLLAAAMGLGCASLHAQNFAIDWHTIDGGGGTSSGENFSLTGTIGQTDANAQPMTGGAFSLTGGFWSLFAVQTPDAPLLTILRISASSARVSWPSPSTGFRLQENADLNTTNWVNAPQAVSDNGTNKFITVNPSAGRRFYRLVKP